MTHYAVVSALTCFVYRRERQRVIDKHGVDDSSHDQDDDKRRGAGVVPTKRQRTHRRHPEVGNWRTRSRLDVVQSRSIRQLRRRSQHPGRSVRGRLKQRCHSSQVVPRAGEEGHAGLERTFRQLHREGPHLINRFNPFGRRVLQVLLLTHCCHMVFSYKAMFVRLRETFLLSSCEFHLWKSGPISL